MRYEDQPKNGHDHPSWELFGILSDIRHDIGGLKVGQELTREQVTDGFKTVHDRINVVHERIDTHLTTPKLEPRGWLQSLGISPKELAGLLLLAAMGLYGTLTPEHVAALLGH